MNLDQIVVTGSSIRTSKMRQSLSVSTLDSEQISHTGATNSAELLRSVPGISLDNMDSTFNDLKPTKAFSLGSGKTTATAGVFYGKQNVDQTWFWNSYNLLLTGNDTQSVDAAGVPTTTPLTTGDTTFAACCVRTWEVEYTQKSPYAGIAWDGGPWNLDASLRRDDESADGYTLSQSPANATLAAGAEPIPGFDPSTRQTVVGTTRSYGDDTNTIVMPGFVITTAFVNTLGYCEVQTDGPNEAHGARPSMAGRRC